MQPILLPANQPADRFYTGGPLIASFRRDPNPPTTTATTTTTTAATTTSNSLPVPPRYERKLSLSQRLQLPTTVSPSTVPETPTVPASAPRIPEDWIASTTTCSGHSSLGLSRLPDGTLLKDAITANPTSWLSPGHIAKFGVDTKLLVKLLDAGQRLPVHAHPHFRWAKEHIGAAHGKAEAWYILTHGVVHLGLKRDVSPEEMLELVEKQDSETLLGLMHVVPVDPHETVYIPPGLLHAIGEGILLAEVQEPEDLSVLLEWKGFQIDGAKEGHLGLGFAKAIGAVELKGRTKDEVESLVKGGRKITHGPVLGDECGEYFRLEIVKVEETIQEEDEAGELQETTAKGIKCEPGFAVLLILDGEVEVVPRGGEGVPVNAPAGSTLVIPYEAGEIVLRGVGRCLFARPPKV